MNVQELANTMFKYFEAMKDGNTRMQLLDSRQIQMHWGNEGENIIGHIRLFASVWHIALRKVAGSTTQDNEAA